MNCTFCGKEILKGTGKIFVTKEGNVSYFCAQKCEKNSLKLGRKKEKVKWTAAYQKEKKVRLIALHKKEK
ncbi:MAG: 50S ribosomal protein L24e [Candidatus Diapherotrites archaeon]|nr:50S ribosomal protein L24e [Candidatus Diapherotrites archaeon]